VQITQMTKSLIDKVIHAAKELGVKDTTSQREALAAARKKLQARIIYLENKERNARHRKVRLTKELT